MRLQRTLVVLSSTAAMFFATAQMAPARADVDMYFRSGVPTRPAPLRVVVSNPRPQYVAIPGTQVYMVRDADHDLYRHAGRYWAYDDGYWYRASRVAGPWVGVRADRVPQSLFYVPAAYHSRWVTVPAQYRVSRSVIKHEVREERREDRRERKAAKHHHKNHH